MKTVIEQPFDQIDTILGIEQIYTQKQLERLLDDLQPFFKRPTQEEILNTPNKGNTCRRYLNTPYIELLKLDDISIISNKQLNLQQNQILRIIQYLARLPNLVCMLSFNQDWYREDLFNLIDKPPNNSQLDNFGILCELSFCIINIKNPLLVNELIKLFKLLLMDDIDRYTYQDNE